MDFNFDYLPSDIEDEVFLSEVPLELIEKAIQTQFMDPFEYRKKDYVQSFLTKYKFSQDNNFNTDEDRYTIEKYHDDFMGFMGKDNRKNCEISNIQYSGKQHKSSSIVKCLTKKSNSTIDCVRVRLFVKN